MPAASPGGYSRSPVSCCDVDWNPPCQGQPGPSVTKPLLMTTTHMTPAQVRSEASAALAVAAAVAAAGADAARGSRERALAEQLADSAWLDELIGAAHNGEVQLTGAGGFLSQLVKRVLEAGLEVEMADHLGYGRGDRAGTGRGTRATGLRPRRC